MSAVEHPKRGRPRSAASEQQILAAALELIAEGRGPASVSIAEIARRACAGKDTIYRRWAGKEELLLDALASTLAPVEVPEGEPLRESLCANLALLIARLQNERDRRVMIAIRSAGDDFPKLRAEYQNRVIARRQEFIRRVVAAAAARGELRGDIDLSGIARMPFDHVIERALDGEPLMGEPRAQAERLIDALLGGILARR
jgi:AcrR family transcriptional regulator